MPAALLLLLVTIASVVFHFLSPWWWTLIVSNWQYIDHTIVLTFWITAVVFVTTPEWQTPETPPPHGNWGGREQPVVYRWAYDYSVPGADHDYVPPNQPSIRWGGQGAKPWV